MQHFETLETRRLLSAVVRQLPFGLEFDRFRGGVVDRDGRATGFTIVQGNTAGDEHQPQLINIRPSAGVLNLYTREGGGGNFESDNTLVNGLQTTFDASRGAFRVGVVIRGPLGYIQEADRQGGILYGPTQDDYLKLVLRTDGGGRGSVQFIDEQGATQHALGRNGVTADLGRLADIDRLELTLAGDPNTGTFSAFYRVNDGVQRQVPGGSLTLNGATRRSFFRPLTRAGIMVMHRNGGPPTIMSFDRFELTPGLPETTRPSVVATRPGPGATAVDVDGFIAADLRLPNPGGGVDTSTLTAQSVRLVRARDGVEVPSNRNTSGGGDAIVLNPNVTLDPLTEYRFEVTDAVRDTEGNAFIPYSTTFTTGRATTEDFDVAFQRITLTNARNRQFSGVTFGPDGRLYAPTLTGEIVRWDVNPDGSLVNDTVINTVTRRAGGPRFITSIAFDPRSTADRPVAWIGHTQFAFEQGNDFTGRISKLYGADLSRYVDVVDQLPRSIRDHVTNQLTFGPDGAIYFPQGSNTAMGSPDNAWGLRPERLLNAAVLRLDVAGAEQNLNRTLAPLNVNTETGGYNPFRRGAPLTIHASGVRNAYDLLFHSNGSLYAPTNGSARGGNTPGVGAGGSNAPRLDAANGPYTGPAVPQLTSVPQTQEDFLFRVEPGRYYGHPNPSRAEFVMNGGNPTANGDPFEVPAYPVGTLPDRNWQAPIHRFGTNVSPNGVIEYQSNAFNGRLRGKILVTRFSGGDDVAVLTPSADGRSIVEERTGFPGLTHFNDPLDLIEDPRGNGNLYVVEYGGRQITLVKPAPGGGRAVIDTSRLFFVDPRGGTASATQQVIVRNTSSEGTVSLGSGSLTLAGSHADLFRLVTPNVPVTLGPGESVGIAVAFDPRATSTLDVKTATLQIRTTATSDPVLSADLRGLPTGGEGGSSEPSLAKLLRLFEFGIDVGDSDPEVNTLMIPAGRQTDEVHARQFVKAGGGPVTLAPIAAFGPDSQPAARLGYYEPGQPDRRTVVSEIDAAFAQAVSPPVRGAMKFDPQNRPFSLFAEFPFFSNPDGTARVVHQEHPLNTWEPVTTQRNRMRVYPLKGADGTIVPHAYLLAYEEATGVGDFQDVLAIVRNVRPVAAGPQVSFTNLDGAPHGDRLVFNQIRTKNPTFPDRVKETGRVRVGNTGSSPLTISGATVTGPFSLTGVSGGSLPRTLAPGESADLTVAFTATGGQVHVGSLRIASNDPDEPVKVVNLAGHWQSDSEDDPRGVSQEPTLRQILDVFGYATAIEYPGQTLDGGGRREAVGDEILSNFWRRADENEPVRVTQLAAYHNQGVTATLRWFPRGSPGNATTVLVHHPLDGQTLMPRANTGTSPAVGSFATDAAFGLRIDNESSDNTQNNLTPQEPTDGTHGHRVRFYPAYGPDGRQQRDTYLVVMDYRGFNYDYNDNVYLVSNIRPADVIAPPVGLTAFPIAGGMLLEWGGVRGATALQGYHVYRSTDLNQPFTRLTRSPIAQTAFRDRSAPAGQPLYYRVTAVGETSESVPLGTFGERPIV